MNNAKESMEERFDAKVGSRLMKGNLLLGKCPVCKHPEVELRDSDIQVRDTFIYKDSLAFITAELTAQKARIRASLIESIDSSLGKVHEGDESQQFKTGMFRGLEVAKLIISALDTQP